MEPPTIADALLNPYGLPERVEFPFDIVSKAGWTEHYLFWAYDQSSDYGICAHINRLPAEPTIWRAVLQFYLPGDELLAVKLHGRDGDARGPGAGGLKVDCSEPFKRFSVTFDGAAHAVSRARITRTLLEDSPAEPIKFTAIFEAAGPIYAPKVDPDFVFAAGAFHSEQVCHMSGQIALRGKVTGLQGMGVRDHSMGTRDYAPVVATTWIHCLFPSGKVVHLQKGVLEAGDVGGAYVFPGDGRPLQPAQIVRPPFLPTPATLPRSLPSDPLLLDGGGFSFAVQAGDELHEVEGRVLAAHATTLAAPTEEFNGTDLARAGALQICDSPALVLCNGEAGVALRERSIRTDRLFAAPVP